MLVLQAGRLAAKREESDALSRAYTNRAPDKLDFLLERSRPRHPHPPPAREPATLTLRTPASLTQPAHWPARCPHPAHASPPPP